VVLEGPRGSARNEFQDLTILRLLQWLTMRTIATEWMLSVELNENGFSFSSLCRNCSRMCVSFYLFIGVNSTGL
jgi:hypothetical protein